MIKFLLFVIFLLLIGILVALNILFPIKGGLVLSLIAVIVTIVKFKESFNSKEKDIEKHSGDWTLIVTSVLYLLLEFLFFLNSFTNKKN